VPANVVPCDQPCSSSAKMNNVCYCCPAGYNNLEITNKGIYCSNSKFQDSVDESS